MMPKEYLIFLNEHNLEDCISEKFVKRNRNQRNFHLSID